MNPLTIFSGPMGVFYRWIVIALLVASAMAWSYMKGVSRESDRRDAIELKQARIEQERYAGAVAFGVGKAREAQAAQAKADKYHQDWKEARNAAKRSGTPLAVGSCDSPAAGQDAGHAAPGGSGVRPHSDGLALRLTWELVGLWDSAYTADDGKPLFGDTARIEKGSAGPAAASPYTLDELVDLHGENATRWDTCRRQLRKLNATIDGLEQKWNKEHAP